MRTTRRRFITISAAAGGLPLLPVWAGRAAPSLRTWTGAALGAGATLQIHHPDPAAADHSISASLAEVARLESAVEPLSAGQCVIAAKSRRHFGKPLFNLVRVLAESRRTPRISPSRTRRLSGLRTTPSRRQSLGLARTRSRWAGNG